MEIDVSQSSGPPLENYGYLKSKATKPLPSSEDFLRALDTSLKVLDTRLGVVAASQESEKNSKGSTAPKQTKP